MELLYSAVAAAALCLVFAFITTRRVLAEDTGTDLMRSIAALIQQGAAAFLRREYTFLAGFVVVVAILIAVFVDFDVTGKFAALGVVEEGRFTGLPRTAIAYIFGAFSSALAGYIGMYVAVRANVRTAAKARIGLNPALRVAFSSGAVMGMTVVGLSLLFLSVLYLVFRNFQPLAGFAFGASSIALFARVGGGIFTKAADVGADLVGKVEAGIPEDDPRNPATIADNVGDNVGDVAGMGADLFESYAGSIVAAMTIGFFAYKDDPNMTSMVVLPLAVSALGILSSIFGAFFVGAKDESQLQSALFRGMVVASIAAAAATWWLCNGALPLPAGVNGNE